MTRPLHVSLTVAALFFAACGVEHADDASLDQQASKLEASFDRAAHEYQVPKAILKSIAYVETRVSHHPQASLTGGYGVMGLVEREDWQMLSRAAELTGQDKERLKVDPDANIRGAAAVLRELADKSFRDYKDLNPNEPGDFFHAVSLYAGLSSAPAGKEYAAEIYRTAEFGFVAKASDGVVAQEPYSTDYRRHLPKTETRMDALKEYPGAYQWKASPNYSSGRTNYTYVLIHTVQGSYSGCISWFQNTSSNVSAHYVVRSSDGQITQMVEHKDTAWHASCYNSKSVGIEHEGYVSDPAKWYTDAMYRESAKLTRWITDRHGIPRTRTNIIGHREVAPACNGNGHTDPGTGWNWTKYMSLVNGTSTSTTTGKLTGAIYHSGNTANRVSGAVVTVNGQSQTTGTDGLYEFNLNPGTYTVSVSKTGYTSASLSRSVTAGTTTWGSMEINQTTATGSLKGKIYVYNSANPSDMTQAISGATVTCNGQTVTTGGDGMYAFTLPPGTYTVNVSAANYQSNNVSRTVVSGGTVWGSVGLSGTSMPDQQAPQIAVSFPQDGASMDIAHITLTGSASDNAGAVATVNVKLNGGAAQSVAVASGAFSEQLKLSPGSNTIEISAADAAGNTGTATATVTFNAGVSGFVYQSGDESARVSEATVSLVDPSNGAIAATATTGVDGSFSLTVDKAGTDYTLTVRRPGFLSTAETLTVPDDARMTVKLPLVEGNDAAPTDVAIELTSPKDGDTVDTETVTLYGVVKGVAVVSVTVNGKGADLFDGGGWTTQLNLELGENTLDIVALGINGEVFPAKMKLTRVAQGTIPEEGSVDQTQVKGGCSVAPGSGFLFLLALVAFRRRRS